MSDSGSEVTDAIPGCGFLCLYQVWISQIRLPTVDSQ